MNTSQPDPLKIAMEVLRRDELPTLALRMAYLSLATLTRQSAGSPVSPAAVAQLGGVSEATARTYLNDLTNRELVRKVKGTHGIAYFIKR